MATLRELVTGKGYDASQGIIDEVSNLVPELNFFDAHLIPGTSFQSVVQTADPTTGFRAVGSGIDSSDEDYRLDTFNLGILAGLVQRDKAAFDADVRGRDAALPAAATSLVRSAMKTLAAKVWYGASTGSEKFSGASALVKAALTVDAGGTAATGASGVTVPSGLSSVYAIGKGLDRCHLVFCESSPLLNSSELVWKEGTMTGSNSKAVPSYWTDLTCWAGFACRNQNSIARIANLNGTKPLTDTLLAVLVSKYAEMNDGMNPDAIFCTFAQRLELQKSRGVNFSTGRAGNLVVPAGVPLEYAGIPIIATGSLTATEAAYSAS